MTVQTIMESQVNMTIIAIGQFLLSYIVFSLTKIEFIFVYRNLNFIITIFIQALVTGIEFQLIVIQFYK